MNSNLQILYDEHEIIVNAIDVAKQLKPMIVSDEELYADTVRQLLSFFRKYADQYHHFKEENILFPEMQKRNELLQDGVIKEMLDNHADFREMIRGIEGYLSEGSYPKAQSLLESYGEALLHHIAVENEEVFQMAATMFNDDELEKINFRFQDCDHSLGEAQKIQQQELLDRMRARMILD